MDDLHELPWPALYDCARLLCGDDMLGEGIDRQVRSCCIDPGLVVKIDSGSRRQNQHEWDFWQALQQGLSDSKGTPAHATFKAAVRWFAPCISISPGGVFLLQKRTAPARPDQFPARVPWFITDMKRTNFGLLDGRLVCHDYGLAGGFVLYNAMATSLRMKRAKWWDETSVRLVTG